MRVGYLECFAGVSGDMMLGALVDAGVPRELLERTVRALGLGAELRFTRVDRSGINAAKVDVMLDGAVADQVEPGGVHSHDDAHSHDHAHPHPLEGPPEHRHEHDGGINTHSHPQQEHGHEHGDGPGHEHLHSGLHSHEADGHADDRSLHLEHEDGRERAHLHRHEHPGDYEHSHPHENSPKHDHDHAHQHGRSLRQIQSLIQDAALGADATALALRTFELLGQAESKIHAVPIETIHFHEVGGVDAIVDIVCAAAGLCWLGVDRWVCSPLNVGGGSVECAHGRFPVPAPATADLLRGAPTYSSGVAIELVTPTGAALIRALDCAFEDAPAMRVETIGYGAGTRDPKRFPNVVRLSIGEATGRPSRPSSFPSEMITVLECAVDDLSPQVLANCTQLALENGALDVMCTPVTMKKGRLGTLLTLLCRQERTAYFEELLFRETSTLGIRVREEQRVFLERAMVEVKTIYGAVRVKVASSRGRVFHSQPEFEDCRRLAAEKDASLKQVQDAALIAYAAAFSHEVEA